MTKEEELNKLVMDSYNQGASDIIDTTIDVIAKATQKERWLTINIDDVIEILRAAKEEFLKETSNA